MKAQLDAFANGDGNDRPSPARLVWETYARTPSSDALAEPGEFCRQLLARYGQYALLRHIDPATWRVALTFFANNRTTRWRFHNLLTERAAQSQQRGPTRRTSSVGPADRAWVHSRRVGADIESPGSATNLVTKSEAVQQHAENGVRLVEVLGTLPLAIDLNVGQSMEHALRSAILAVRLGDALGLDETQLTDCYYLALLRHVGCTAEARTGRRYSGTKSQRERGSRPWSTVSVRRCSRPSCGTWARTNDRSSAPVAWSVHVWACPNSCMPSTPSARSRGSWPSGGDSGRPSSAPSRRHSSAGTGRGCRTSSEAKP